MGDLDYHFSRRSASPLRRHCGWVLEVSGPEAVAEFLLRRMEMGLVEDTVTPMSVRLMVGVCHKAMQADVEEFRALLAKPKASRQTKKQRTANWEEQKRKLIAREDLRRSNQQLIGATA